jgi:Na+-driven multidrug efflux pump
MGMVFLDAASVTPIVVPGSRRLALTNKHGWASIMNVPLMPPRWRRLDDFELRIVRRFAALARLRGVRVSAGAVNVLANGWIYAPIAVAVYALADGNAWSVIGAAALAGYTIAIRVVVFVLLPSWGLSNAAATLVGQNLGAKKPDRAAASVWRTGLYNMLFLGGVGVVFVFFAEPVVRLFTQDPEVIPLGASCLRIISYGNIGYAYGMVMLQAFNGAGDTVTPTVVNFFGFWLLEIPLAYWLAIPLKLRSNGVFFSIVIAEGAIALASAILFKRGRWKTQQI